MVFCYAWLPKDIEHPNHEKLAFGTKSNSSRSLNFVTTCIPLRRVKCTVVNTYVFLRRYLFGCIKSGNTAFVSYSSQSENTVTSSLHLTCRKASNFKASAKQANPLGLSISIEYRKKFRLRNDPNHPR